MCKDGARVRSTAGDGSDGRPPEVGGVEAEAEYEHQIDNGEGTRRRTDEADDNSRFDEVYDEIKR